MLTYCFSAPLQLRPYGAIQICLLLLFCLIGLSEGVSDCRLGHVPKGETLRYLEYVFTARCPSYYSTNCVGLN